MGGCISEPAVSVDFAGFGAVRKLQSIGFGSYSTVYLAALSSQSTKHQDQHQLPKHFALKILRCQTEELLEQAKHEIEMLQKFNHPNIAKLYASKIVTISNSSTIIYLLLPYCSSGTVEDFVKKNGKTMTEKQILSIFEPICRALQQLHNYQPLATQNSSNSTMNLGLNGEVDEEDKQWLSTGLAHRDIKPSNVLLTPSNYFNSNSDDQGVIPILIDFGSVSRARHHPKTYKMALQLMEHCDRTCSPLYRAPELFEVQVDSRIDERTDVWSMGCFLYFMVYGCSPFDHVVTEMGGSIKLAVVNAKIDYPDPKKELSNDLENLMKSMLSLDLAARPHISEILQLPIFKERVSEQ